MGWQQIMGIALRQTLDPGDGLSGFLSRVSIVGLVLAVALLLAVMSVMNGFEQEMRGRILSLVPHVTVRGSAPSDEWRAQSESLAGDPTVLERQLFFDTDALMIRGQRARALRLLGLAGNLDRYAQALSPRHVDLAPGDLVLGAGLASQLGLDVGDSVTLLAPGGGAGATGRPGRFVLRALIDTGTELDEQLALAGLNDVGKLVGQAGAINGLALTLDDLFEAPRWQWQLSRSLPLQFYVTDWTASHGNLYSAIQLSRNLILLLMASIIAVAAFNVVSSLVLVVTDRSQSIAMLRAVGATPRDVVLIYLLQGAVIGLLGSFGGCLLGWLLSQSAPSLAEGLSALMGRPLLNTDVYPIGFLPVATELRDYLVVSATALLLCLVAAAFPAWRAARLGVAATLAR